MSIVSYNPFQAIISYFHTSKGGVKLRMYAFLKNTTKILVLKGKNLKTLQDQGICLCTLQKTSLD